jgi:hypothetical protein
MSIFVIRKGFAEKESDFNISERENLVLIVKMRKKRYKTKNAVFWDVAPCGSCKNRLFGGTYRLYLHGIKICAREKC